MPTSPYDLTTVTNAKIWTNATASATDDVTLQRLITSVSKQIIHQLGRNPFLNMNMEVRSGNGNNQMFMRNYPIARMISLQFLGGYNAGVSSYFGALLNIPTASQGTQYGFTYTDNTITLFGLTFPCGQANVKAQYIGGYTDTAFENTVLASTSYTVANAGSFIEDMGVFYADGTPMHFTTSLTPSRGSYHFTYGNLLMFNVSAGGIYTFSPDDVGSGIVVCYKYGKIPEDLEQIAIEAVSFLSMKRKSIGQTTSNAGGQRTTYINSALPPETLDKLRNFNSVVPVV